MTEKFAVDYIESHGGKFYSDGRIYMPIERYDNLLVAQCIEYLCNEWDYCVVNKIEGD
jgi:hypothetical protein